MKRFWRDQLINPFRQAMHDLPWFGPVVSTVLLGVTVNVMTETLTVLGGPALGWANEWVNPPLQERGAF